MEHSCGKQGNVNKNGIEIGDRIRNGYNLEFGEQLQEMREVETNLTINGNVEMAKKGSFQKLNLGWSQSFLSVVSNSEILFLQ